METSKLDWLEKRKKGVGGSDVAAICGLSPYRTPLQVWEDKRGLSGPIQDNDSMFWGRTLEPTIRQRYSDLTGRSVLLPTEILQHQEHPFMLANIDGFTPDKRGVEIKTTAYPSGWGEPGTDEIPTGYIFQVQHYMIITGFPVFDVPVLIGGRDFRIYEVPEDKELQEMLIQKEAEFWHLVETGVPPAPVNYEDVVRLYRQSEAKTVTATEIIEGWIDRLKKIKKAMEINKAGEEEAKAEIMKAMGEADTLLSLKGDVLATWKTTKPTKRLDIRCFENTMPDVFKKFLITGDPQRRFLLKNERGGDK